MKQIVLFLNFVFSVSVIFGQAGPGPRNDSQNTAYKKRVLEHTEIDVLSSFYMQNGENAAVTGGIGNEKLTDFATNINVSIPLNADDVLTIDGTVSAYSSASSSNLNPFSGASQSGERSRGEHDDDDDERNRGSGSNVGSPWVASSGASRSDVWSNGSLGYQHTSDDRNTVYGANLSVSREFDYGSIGAGLAISHQFNEKNTELGMKANVYLDRWYPQYPTEIKTYIETRGNLNADYFNGVEIFNQNGIAIDKYGTAAWQPLKNNLVSTDQRNTYSVSITFSQILSQSTQISLFSDLIMQKGWLSNPMQRVYFSDRDNFYIGSASSIPNYENSTNSNVFQLADDIERLPENRIKIPIGVRFHQYLNEFLTIKSYYRYYQDNWGIKAHTAQIELPIKLGNQFTIYPNYRYYTQTAAIYFAPYEEHLSTEQFYTSDYDLSAFEANQFGVGLKYTDIFTKAHLGKLALKNLSLDYGMYLRSTGLTAHIVSVGAKFVLD
ncbi:MAG: DUF3570 domain-containing protein [Saprospiraceae bacterium]|nr:DUF3570 domain-containing protein [Saprospiraceae bacterium]